MSAGAFSDPAVVEASKAFVCVYVDCDWGRKNRELSERYGITGYPTVLLCAPDGRAVERLRSRDAKDVAAQLRDFVPDRPAAAPAAPRPWSEQTLGEAALRARQTERPLAVFFHDDSPASETVRRALADEDLALLRSRFVFWAKAYAKGSREAELFGVDRAPAIVVVDATRPEPHEKPLARIVGSRSARELERELAPLVERRDPLEPPPTAKPPPSKEPPAEELSDDEIDRRFIRANVKVAREMLGKGNRAKALEILEDTVKSYPKHVETKEVRRLLEEIRAK